MSNGSSTAVGSRENGGKQMERVQTRFSRSVVLWDREGGRAAQEGGDMGIYVYV